MSVKLCLPRAPVLDELVGAEALLTLLTVHQRIGEAAQMAGGHPGLGVHQDGGVQTHVVGVLLDELLPPGLLDVVLQLHTQGAVVPGVGQAAVDLGAGEDEAAALAQGDDLLHGLFGVFHGTIKLLLFVVTFAPEGGRWPRGPDEGAWERGNPSSVSLRLPASPRRGEAHAALRSNLPP